MALPLATTGRPRCLACIRALSQHEPAIAFRPFFLQFRGKKKKPNRHHMQIVKLVEDITSYGPKGSIMAVPPGLMRNYWFPQGIAQYITGKDLTDVQRKPELLHGRDTDFGKQEVSTTDAIVKIETQLLSPERSEELLQKLLPEYIEVSRTPISASEQSKVQASEAETVERSVQAQYIFGSVSPQDILQNIKQYLTLRAAETENADASRIVLQPDDIKITLGDNKNNLEEDRIKRLGDFTFDIHVKGAGTLRRQVRVVAQS